MTDEEVSKVFEKLSGPLIGGSEIYRIERFQMVRTRKDDGRDVSVVVDVLDGGPDAGLRRYLVKARDDEGRSTMGNGASKLDVALNGVHWNNLDSADSASS